MAETTSIAARSEAGSGGKSAKNEIWLALTGSKSRLERRPLPENDPMQRRPDIARAKAVLGWEPTVALEEGLAGRSPTYRLRGAAAAPA